MSISRLLHIAQPPLAWYVRVGRNDHKCVLQVLSERPRVLTGIVSSPAHVDRHADLRAEATRQRVEVVLDPLALELSAPRATEMRGLSRLPWAGTSPHATSDLRGAGGLRMVEKIARFVAEHGYTSVLAPAHLVTSSSDPWLAIDRDLVTALRAALDKCGLEQVPVYYPLVVDSPCWRAMGERFRLVAALRDLPVDAIWLRIHGFGGRSSGPALRRYVEACQDFMSLGVPLVGERIGTAGPAMLAFGAVGGIESGVTIGEQFNARTLFRERRSGRGFLPPPRVYLREIGAFLTRSQATAFFDVRGTKSRFGCRFDSCCRRGVSDTLRDPRRHFLIQRGAEVAGLSKAPPHLRASMYLDDFLRPASDLVVRAAQISPALERHRATLESWRYTLGVLEGDGKKLALSAPPEGRRLLARKTA